MSAKRCRDGDDPSELANKRHKFGLVDEERLSDFNEWMLNNGLHLNKVRINRIIQMSVFYVAIVSKY